MIGKRPHHTPRFRITQYAIALTVGLLAAWLAPVDPPEEFSAKTYQWEPLALPPETATWWHTSSVLPDISPIDYPWVQFWNLPGQKRYWHTLTQDQFRCRGQGGCAPILLEQSSSKRYLFDCWGMIEHGLPWDPSTQRERIQPALIEILGQLQQRLSRRVVVTSAHRCPTHHLYITRGTGSSVDKHLIGAAADFYVEACSKEVVVAALQQICLERRDRAGESLSHKPWQLSIKEEEHWQNFEIALRHHRVAEDLDNQCHGRGYFELQVRYDLERSQEVRFNSKQASRLPLN